MNHERGEFNHHYQPELLWEKTIIRYTPRIILGMLAGAGIGFLGASALIVLSGDTTTYSSDAFTTIYNNLVITHATGIRKASAVIGTGGGGIFAGYATYRKWV